MEQWWKRLYSFWHCHFSGMPAVPKMLNIRSKYPWQKGNSKKLLLINCKGSISGCLSFSRFHLWFSESLHESGKVILLLLLIYPLWIFVMRNIRTCSGSTTFRGANHSQNIVRDFGILNVSQFQRCLRFFWNFLMSHGFFKTFSKAFWHSKYLSRFWQIFEILEDFRDFGRFLVVLQDLEIQTIFEILTELLKVFWGLRSFGGGDV